MGTARTLRLIWFVTWFNVRMLLASEFFILTTFICAAHLRHAGLLPLPGRAAARPGQTLLYVALGARDDGRLEHDPLRLRRRHRLAALGGDAGAAGQRAVAL